MINIFKPLSSFPLTHTFDKLSSINNFSSEKFREQRERNPGLLGERQLCYLGADQAALDLNILCCFFQPPKSPASPIPDAVSRRAVRNLTSVFAHGDPELNFVSSNPSSSNNCMWRTKSG